MEKMKNKWIVLGATGLVGKELVQALSLLPETGEIHVFGRRPLENAPDNVVQHVVDMGNPITFAQGITGDALFCCLGTTIKQAGSQAAFRSVDFQMPVEIGAIARNNGIPVLAVISSMGARAGSSIFYSKVKGEMEAALEQQHWPQLYIVRPSLLLGERNEKRMGEAVGEVIVGLLKPFLSGPLLKYRGITAATVAKAMISLVLKEAAPGIYESDTLQELGK